MEKYIKDFERYLKNERKYPDNTVISYLNDLYNYKQYIHNKVLNFKTINKDEIREYLKHLDKEKKSKSSISRELSALRNFYTFLLHNNIIDNNPFKNIKNPKKDKKLPNFLQNDELQNIFDTIDISNPLGIRNRLIIELLLDTGMRVFELENLKIKDINFSNGETSVLGKGKKYRYVKIHPNNLNLIKRWTRFPLNTTR